MDTLSAQSSPFNPVALITGAASGIGLAIAHRLARLATGGLLLIDSNEDALAAAADSLSDPPERVSMLAMDVRDEQRWRDARGFIAAHYGRLDWAVVSAGIASASPIAETTLEEWRRVVSINLDGAFLTLQTAMPFMRNNSDGGAVVLIGSATGFKAEVGTGAYGASKAGLLQLMRVAAKEGAPDRIRVNAIAPGGVETPMWRDAPFFQDLVDETGSERAAFDKLAAMGTPLARFASADDIARLTETLLVDCPTVTGATLVADGGYSL